MMSSPEITMAEAFEVLQSVLQRRINEAQEDSSAAMQEGQYRAARERLADLDALLDLLERTNALEQEFGKYILDQANEGGRLRGVKTPQHTYRVPILEALVEMGGTGQAADVLDRVFEKIKYRLNEYDLAMLPSKTDYRWRNTANWAKFALIEDGLLRDDSPRGTWEITEAGRRWVEEKDN